MRFKKNLIIASTGLILILILTHIPQKFLEPAVGISHADKLFHLTGYFLVSFFAFADSGIRKNRWTFLCLVSTLFLISALDEATQPLVCRSASLWDWFMDAAGIGLGVLLRSVRGLIHV